VLADWNLTSMRLFHEFRVGWRGIRAPVYKVSHQLWQTSALPRVSLLSAMNFTDKPDNITRKQSFVLNFAPFEPVE
jgi:hypothetical protein